MFRNVGGYPQSTTEEGRKNNIRRASDMMSEDKNPCIKEHNLVHKCLSDKFYDKDECSSYFANYNACKDFWGHIMKDRRSKGIVPYLPPGEERDKIKKEYLNSKLH